MSKEDMGWRGKLLKHADGRTGIIAKEYVGFGHIALTLRIDGTDKTESIQLNSDGRDSGATGWLWRHTDEGVKPEIWSLLGDHNHEEARRA
jgi:hypothetical protein